MNKNMISCNNHNSKREWKLIMNVKRKIHSNKLTITKANKGKTLVIITEEEYKQKIMEFIQDNNFTLTNKDPTQQYQSNVKQ
jgi:PHD/YefM family antitoxin component YafN of YafNO toxin-antitoxin module